jgi:hypothetical protein
VERTGRLIAVTSAEFGIEDLHVARARHWCQRHRQLAVVDPEHVLAELVPVAAAVPKFFWQQLWRPDLSIASSVHLAPEIVLQRPVDRVAARMPEHHARRIFLKVPEFELHAEISVVEIIHGCVPCDGKQRGRDHQKPKKRPRPSPAGPFLGEVRLFLARATSRRSAVSGHRGRQCC